MSDQEQDPAQYLKQRYCTMVALLAIPSDFLLSQGVYGSYGEVVAGFKQDDFSLLDDDFKMAVVEAVAEIAD